MKISAVNSSHLEVGEGRNDLLPEGMPPPSARSESFLWDALAASWECVDASTLKAPLVPFPGDRLVVVDVLVGVVTSDLDPDRLSGVKNFSLRD